MALSTAIWNCLGSMRKENVALADALALVNVDLRDEAGHVGRDHELRGVDVGVVGRDVAPAGHPQHEGDQRNQQRRAEHKRLSQAPAGPADGIKSPAHLRGWGERGFWNLNIHAVPRVRPLLRRARFRRMRCKQVTSDSSAGASSPSAMLS